MANDYGYQELQLVMWDFTDISIDFYPKEAMEFTATAPISKLEVPQHVTVVSILFYRCRFFTLATLHICIVYSLFALRAV